MFPTDYLLDRSTNTTINLDRSGIENTHTRSKEVHARMKFVVYCMKYIVMYEGFIDQTITSLENVAFC